jgi:phage terminase Nu1 subunit (DNA packaging protein)
VTETTKDTEVPSGTFAEIVGVDPNTVRSWVASGLPARRDGRAVLIRLAEGVQWVRSRDRDALEKVRASADPEGAKNAKLAAEARLKEMDVLERAGKLMLADDAEAAWIHALTAFREAVLSIAGNAVQAGIIPAKLESELDDLAREALTVLGSRLRNLPAAPPVESDV